MNAEVTFLLKRDTLSKRGLRIDKIDLQLVPLKKRGGQIIQKSDL